MLEFVKDKKGNNKVRLWYEFESDYVDEEEYSQYDGDEFHYDIDYDDAKDQVAYGLSKIIESNHYLDILDALNELDGEELFDWNLAIEKWEDELLDWWKTDAMDYFVENHHIFNQDDYNDLMIDRALEERE